MDDWPVGKLLHDTDPIEIGRQTKFGNGNHNFQVELTHKITFARINGSLVENISMLFMKINNHHECDYGYIEFSQKYPTHTYIKRLGQYIERSHLQKKKVKKKVT